MTATDNLCADLCAFVDGELEAGRATAFRDHLAGCEACPAELFREGQLTARLSERKEPTMSSCERGAGVESLTAFEDDDITIDSPLHAPPPKLYRAVFRALTRLWGHYDLLIRERAAQRIAQIETLAEDCIREWSLAQAALRKLEQVGGDSKLILPCTDELALSTDFAAFGPIKGRLVAGFDVGRKRDLSELSIFEELDGKKVCRMLRSYDRVPFADQEGELRRMLNTLPIARLSIDQNGIGMHLAENLSREFAVVVPETFTTESKEIWATDFKILLQRKEVQLPRDRQLVAQIHSIRRRLSPTGKALFEVEADEIVRGHSDRFGSVALACQKERRALPGTVPEIHVRIIG